MRPEVNLRHIRDR
uniref:Hook microtubule tethering protein 3 n=1 Tax=Myotis myotis TaxID=51298 RepID=A0A7J7Z414_MYOMY|nr:hook microtubule tethering protein 3 [Myotis myotis]